MESFIALRLENTDVIKHTVTLFSCINDIKCHVPHIKIYSSILFPKFYKASINICVYINGWCPKIARRPFAGGREVEFHVPAALVGTSDVSEPESVEFQ